MHSMTATNMNIELLIGGRAAKKLDYIGLSAIE